MKKDTLTEIMKKEIERQETIEKNLDVNLLELILMQEIMIFFLKW